MGPISTHFNFSLGSTILMPNRCDDQALARIEQVCASAMETLSPPYLAKEASSPRLSRGQSGDRTGK
jgi:hypothetical protein